jgi:putative FmdB family regulatory protein
MLKGKRGVCPIYPFNCYDCNESLEIFKARMESPKTPICPKCKKKMARVFSSTVDATMIERPRYSLAMGVNPSQIAQAKKIYPGSEYNAKGDLLVRNRRHKLYEASRRGMSELE